MRVLLVAPNASARMGGEAILPLHWLRELRALGVDAHLLTHERCRAELEDSPYAEMPISYVADSSGERAVWRFQKGAKGFAWRASGFLLSLLSMMRLGKEVRRKVDAEGFDLIHQVIPVSPRLASPVTHKTVPVVIGPLNGNMRFPDGFAKDYGDGSEAAEEMARGLSAFTHRLLPGKPNAARILVSNQRTEEGLPEGVNRGRVTHFIENGVDLDQWQASSPLPEGPARFIFVGRLVNWKAVDILLDAFSRLDAGETLTICGDGPERGRLERFAKARGLEDRVTFTGRVPQDEITARVADSHVLVLPSLYECGGAVVLEAMAMERAVIASDWGGPSDYVTPETGILIEPTSRQGFSDALANAMRDLGGDMDRIKSMGQAGRKRVEQHFAWKKKGEAMLRIYKEILGGS
ncbi:glycosyltransferase family 4 protein [Parvularcula lutaonensis]|uniref:Glycosyltransferase family 4 protein n=1 Tax=Parvularcula lutaonensis TaxID=491923 RepID=A0ABV7MAN8_9PROT|nr:glycosyltransferase family 4 protein [Parvularcula lutaonensis]GGY36565.1 hypothetical protein GCM10007148_00930 [Parvularcula lutaonensis]